MKKTPKKFFSKKKKQSPSNIPSPINLENLRLNKFMAHCGVGNRRVCEIFIKKGLVTVNDKVVTESAYRVQKNDVIKYEGKRLELKKQYTYILLNKPKGYLPTFEKLDGEKTFQNIFSDKIKVKISPVGNLEKTSAGLLLLTDDEMWLEKKAKKEETFKSIFHLILSNPIEEEALQNLQKTLVESHPNFQSLSHVKRKGKEEVGVEMKGGDDIVLREAIEKAGLIIEKLDRVFFSGLTKKDLPRGRYRILTEKESIFLKHFS